MKKWLRFVCIILALAFFGGCSTKPTGDITTETSTWSTGDVTEASGTTA